jgi:hypothetical protein
VAAFLDAIGHDAYDVGPLSLVNERMAHARRRTPRVLSSAPDGSSDSCLITVVLAVWKR